jgi:diguanylate cyclase (GGDEF)-like protein
VRSSLVIRWAAPTLLLLYCGLRTALPEALVANEFILYNLIPLAALIATIAAPTFNNLTAVIASSLAIIAWWIGSLLSSYNQYLEPIITNEQYQNIGYLLFYPLVLLALYRMNNFRRKLTRSELLDSLLLLFIFFSAFVILIANKGESGPIQFSFQNYMHILYLFFDAVFVIWVFRLIIIDGLSARNIALSSGLLLFLASDLSFVWTSTLNSYIVGEIIDFGWVAGITAIAFALWCEDSSVQRERTLHPFTLITSLLISVALLTLLALRGREISTLIAVPAFLALLLAIVRITAVLQKSHQLNDESYLAHIDELTGLANRRKIIAELSTFNQNEGAFLLLDLDGFKPINDQYGHGTGDQILQEIAERFTRALPASAVIARLGGDEFGVIVKGSYEETLEGAYALQASLSYPFTISGQKISVGVSIGYVHNDGRGDLLKRADIAMYQAKNSDEGVVQS